MSKGIVFEGEARIFRRQNLESETTLFDFEGKWSAFFDKTLLEQVLCAELDRGFQALQIPC